MAHITLPETIHIDEVYDVVDEIEVLKAEIEKLKKPKWQSGYLRSIYG